MELRDLVAELAILKEQKKNLEQEIKGINACIESTEEQIVICMLNSGSNRQSFPGIGTASISPKDYPRIVDKELFFEFLRKTNQEGLIQETVNARTLASWFKEQEFSKEEYTAIGLSNFQKTKVNLRRA